MVSLERTRPRNGRLVDWWSLTHVAWGIILSLLVGPFAALVLLSLWEPFEILVLSRIAAHLGVDFGHEALENSLMDLIFNVLGVLIATFGILPFTDDLPFWRSLVPDV
jgi:hypothetical protein